MILQDSRVAEENNAAYLDLMEDYFNQPLEDLRRDLRPPVQLHPRLAEQAAPAIIMSNFNLTQSTQSLILVRTGFMEEAAPSAIMQPCKSAEPATTMTTLNFKLARSILPFHSFRFFWHMNPQVPELHSSNVVPSADFLRKRWSRIMDQWGQSMKNA